MKYEHRAFEVEAAVRIRISDRTVDDIMVTALEGGISYWCGAARVVGRRLGADASEQISRGGTLMLYDAESSDKWELTLDKFLQGVRRWVENDDGIGALVDGELDASEVDANAADVIVQYALFGQLVFA